MHSCGWTSKSYKIVYYCYITILLLLTNLQPLEVMEFEHNYKYHPSQTDPRDALPHTRRAVACSGCSLRQTGCRLSLVLSTSFD